MSSCHASTSYSAWCPQIVEAADRREDAAKLLASKVFTQMFEVTNSR